MNDDRETRPIEALQRDLEAADPADAPAAAEKLADELAARLEEPAKDDGDEAS